MGNITNMLQLRLGIFFFFFLRWKIEILLDKYDKQYIRILYTGEPRPILQKWKHYAGKQTISTQTNNYVENNTMQKSNRHAKANQITINCLIEQLSNVDTPAENLVLH